LPNPALQPTALRVAAELEALRKLKARVYSDQMPIKTKVTGMETKTITIHVSPEAASAYETASADQQRKLDALLSLKLGEVIRAKRPLEVIMSEISRKAQERGLTQGNRIKISHLAPQQVGKVFSAPARFQSLVFDP